MAKLTPELRQRWLTVWNGSAVRWLPTCDLARTTMTDGATAVWCIPRDKIPVVVIDDPLIDCLLMRDEGFFLTAWVEAAVLEFRRTGRRARVMMPKPYRVLRRQLLDSRAIPP